MKLTLVLVQTAVILEMFSAIVTGQESTKDRPLVEIESTGLSLVKPDDFELAAGFNGFQQSASSSSVMVSVLPAPFSKLVDEFNADGLTKKGMRLISIEKVVIDNTLGRLIGVAQVASGIKFRKWIAMLGDEDKSYLVVASFPEDVAGRLSDSLREVVLSATRNNAAIQPPKLPFRLGNVDGLVLVEKMQALGKMICFNKDGIVPEKPGPESESDPVFIATSSFGTVELHNRQRFATERVAALEGFKLEKLRTVSEVNIDGVAGLEIEAIGRSTKSQAELFVNQVMLFPPEGGYVLMAGIVGRKEAAKYLRKFKALARTYQQNPSTGAKLKSSD